MPPKIKSKSTSKASASFSAVPPDSPQMLAFKNYIISTCEQVITTHNLWPLILQTLPSSPIALNIAILTSIHVLPLHLNNVLQSFSYFLYSEAFLNIFFDEPSVCERMIRLINDLSPIELMTVLEFKNVDTLPLFYKLLTTGKTRVLKAICFERDDPKKLKVGLSKRICECYIEKNNNEDAAYFLVLIRNDDFNLLQSLEVDDVSSALKKSPSSLINEFLYDKPETKYRPIFELCLTLERRAVFSKHFVIINDIYKKHPEIFLLRSKLKYKAEDFRVQPRTLLHMMFIALGYFDAMDNMEAGFLNAVIKTNPLEFVYSELLPIDKQEELHLSCFEMLLLFDGPLKNLAIKTIEKIDGQVLVNALKIREKTCPFDKPIRFAFYEEISLLSLCFKTNKTLYLLRKPEFHAYVSEYIEKHKDLGSFLFDKPKSGGKNLDQMLTFFEPGSKVVEAILEFSKKNRMYFSLDFLREKFRENEEFRSSFLFMYGFNFFGADTEALFVLTENLLGEFCFIIDWNFTLSIVIRYINVGSFFTVANAIHKKIDLVGLSMLSSNPELLEEFKTTLFDKKNERAKENKRREKLKEKIIAFIDTSEKMKVIQRVSRWYYNPEVFKSLSQKSKDDLNGMYRALKIPSVIPEYIMSFNPDDQKIDVLYNKIVTWNKELEKISNEDFELLLKHFDTEVDQCFSRLLPITRPQLPSSVIAPVPSVSMSVPTPSWDSSTTVESKKRVSPELPKAYLREQGRSERPSEKYRYLQSPINWPCCAVFKEDDINDPDDSRRVGVNAPIVEITRLGFFSREFIRFELMPTNFETMVVYTAFRQKAYEGHFCSSNTNEQGIVSCKEEGIIWNSIACEHKLKRVQSDGRCYIVTEKSKEGHTLYRVVHYVQKTHS